MTHAWKQTYFCWLALGWIMLCQVLTGLLRQVFILLNFFVYNWLISRSHVIFLRRVILIPKALQSPDILLRAIWSWQFLNSSSINDYLHLPMFLSVQSKKDSLPWSSKGKEPKLVLKSGCKREVGGMQSSNFLFSSSTRSSRSVVDDMLILYWP